APVATKRGGESPRPEREGAEALSGMLSGPASVDSCRAPAASPGTAGVNCTDTAHVSRGSSTIPAHASAATDRPAGAVPPTVAAPIWMGTPPGFVTVTVAWLARPGGVGGRDAAAGKAVAGAPGQSRPSRA